MIDLFNEIALLVPPHHQASYWRMIARLRKMHPDDEILVILWGMGILTQITVNVPASLCLQARKIEKMIQQHEALNRHFKKDISRAAAALHRSRYELASTLLRQIDQRLASQLASHQASLRRSLWLFSAVIVGAQTATICAVLLFR